MYDNLEDLLYFFVQDYISENVGLNDLLKIIDSLSVLTLFYIINDDVTLT
jgi:hypothetical protein